MAARRRCARRRRSLVWMEERFPAGLPSEDEFAARAECELDALPGWIKSAIATHNVAISIEDQRLNEPRTLGMFAQYNGASEITLYRLPINRIAVDRLEEAPDANNLADRDRPRPLLDREHSAPRRPTGTRPKTRRTGRLRVISPR